MRSETAVLVLGLPALLPKLVTEQVLAHESTTVVYAIVLPEQVADASSLFVSMADEQRERLVILEGNPSFIDLGLSGAEFRELSSSLSRIYNFAYSTDSRLERQAADFVNVQSVREVLELAKECRRLQVLLHCSSAMLSGRASGIVLEDEFDESATFFSPVDESRHRAELIMRRFMAKLPITVVRPSIIVGESMTGETDQFDCAYCLFGDVVNSSDRIAVPMRDLPMNLVPADFVARAAYQIGRDSRSVGNSYHLVDPSPLNAPRVFELVAKAAKKDSPAGYVPGRFARALSRVPGFERVMKSPRAYFDLLAVPVHYDARKAELLLAGSGVVCPAFESYVERLVAFMLARATDARPESKKTSETEVSVS